MAPRSCIHTIASLLVFGSLLWTTGVSLGGEGDNIIPTGRIEVAKRQQSVQMIVSTSQYLTFPQNIMTVTMSNESIIKLNPTNKNEILVSALATGVTQIDAKGLDDSVYNVQIVVISDARELQSILAQHFPTATLQVQPIRDAVIISGQVTSDEHVEQVVAIAEEFYQRVINKIEVIGVHTIMLQTQVMEVSRTKLRQLGIDWSMGIGNDFVTQNVSGLVGAGATTGGLLNAGNETFKFGVLDSGNQFFGLVRALKQNNLAKVLADPTVVALDGRPASFNSGGEFPIPIPAGLNQVGIEFREFGTRLEFVAKVRGDGRIWLEIRPMISEVDPSRTVSIAGVTVPGLRSRFVDTSVELRAGQTLALAGLLQVRTEAESVGLIGLSDIPYLGALFRSNREIQNEVELLILVTPNFAAPMDPHEVPPGGPGFNSDSPLDKELYMHGHIEVPTTCGPGNVTLLPSSAPTQGTMLYGSAYSPTGDAVSKTPPRSVPAKPVSTANRIQNLPRR
jgi:pilus assembly protein CpaC